MIELTLRLGRSRRAACFLLYVCVALSAYRWLGNAGLGLAALWWRSAWPAEHQRYRWNPAQVQAVWLWGNTMAVRFYGGAVAWVFADELPPAEFAAVRRRLKSQVEGLL